MGINGYGEVQIDKVVQTLTCACDASMPRRIKFLWEQLIE